MLGRLLLALLLATFAVPAAAAVPACHDVPAATAVMHHGAPAVPEKATAHLCIGCVPIADWLVERVSERLPVAAPRPMPRIERLDVGESGPPALPPPRAA